MIAPRSDCHHQRVEWSGAAKEPGEAWRLRKGSRSARCVITNHPMGWELRLSVDGELIRSQVFREQFQLLDAAAEWKGKMIGAGWEEPPAIEVSGSMDS